MMRRGYIRKDIDMIFDLFNTIGFADFSTDMIVGFPGETAETHEETIQFILQHKPKYILLSAFMESPLLAAYSLPNKVDDETKQQRLMDADARLSCAGIYCSTDGGLLSTDRLRRVNLD
jgi:tRNA A37 methylthiotransferase MiaB